MAGEAGAASSVELAAAGELLARAVGRCSRGSGLMAVHRASRGDAADADAGRQVAARLAAIKPCLAAHVAAAATSGLECHTARGLVSRDVFVRANAARHHGFSADFSKMSAADCRRAQRGAGRRAAAGAATAATAAPECFDMAVDFSEVDSTSTLGMGIGRHVHGGLDEHLGHRRA